MIPQSSAWTLFARPPRTQYLTKKYQVALDLSVLVSAFILAYLLRFDFNIPPQVIPNALSQLCLVVLVQFVVLIPTGIYRFIWRYIGMSEIKAFINAALWSALIILLLRVGLPVEFEGWRVPLSVIVVDTFFAFGGVLGLRVLRRATFEHSDKKKRQNAGGKQAKKRVLLIGAGRAGMLTAREVKHRDDVGLEIIGFIDDEPQKQQSIISGVRVLGTTSDLERLVKALRIDHVIISIAHASRQDFRRLLDICERIPVKVRVIPGMGEILQGKVKVSRIRDLQVEDLLGREAVNLDEEGIKEFITAKTVMVTGAGGSIGSELVRQITRFAPSKLLLVERNEFALFNIERELHENQLSIRFFPLLADVGDEARMRSIFRQHRPDVVFHAAAHKHVTMMEDNSCEAIKNNVLATRLLGEIAGEAGAEAFVLISTDKAVRPKSIMGASKRVAELVVQDLNRLYDTRFGAVRFGNVIGSTGSVIPIFHEQIKKGGPVTVTHPDVARYFMTIPEAAQLVLQAGAIGEGGEIFILDMGEPIRIYDLAKETISLAGLKPNEDLEIVFTGLRPGEKLYEELKATDENATKTRHPKIFIGKIAVYPHEKISAAIYSLKLLAKDERQHELRRFLNGFLPEAQLEMREGTGDETDAASSGQQSKDQASKRNGSLLRSQVRSA